MAETGGYYDQPAVYLDIMTEMGSAIGDSMDPDFKKNMTKRLNEAEDDKIQALKDLGIGIPIIQK